MTPLDSIAHSLMDALPVAKPPTAIAFTDVVPEGVKTFAGTVPAGCRLWQEAPLRRHSLAAI